MWKMLHLLYRLRPGQPGLSYQQLEDIGIDCRSDTIDSLRKSDLVSYRAGMHTLTEAARRILGTCVVANERWSSDDIWVYYPSAFVVIPFEEAWSNTVFEQMIKPGW